MASNPPIISHRNIVKVIEEARSLQHDARLLSAGDFVRRVDEYLLNDADHTRKEIKAAVNLLEGKLKGAFDDLRRRASECVSTLSDWHSSDWVLAQTFMGITTSYKHDHDGSIWVKLHGTMDNVRLITQLATIREVDLFRHWVPFCDQSSLLKNVGVVEMLAYFRTTIPGVVSRDCVLHVYGCDAVLEEKCILIQGRSVEEWAGVEMPKVKGWTHARMDVKAFKAKIEVLSPTSSSASIVAKVDLKTPLPHSVVNFVLRKGAGMLLYYLQQTARRISTDEDSRHRKRIMEDTEFYAQWLYPRVERFYHKMGWDVNDCLAMEGHPSTLMPTLERRMLETSQYRPVRRLRRSRVKRALGHLRRKLRSKAETDQTAVTKETEVDLGIDPRLLTKWQARKEMKLRGDAQAGTSTIRLLLYFSFALVAALGSSMWSTFRKTIHRFPTWFSYICFGGIYVVR